MTTSDAARSTGERHYPRLAATSAPEPTLVPPPSPPVAPAGLPAATTLDEALETARASLDPAGGDATLQEALVSLGTLLLATPPVEAFLARAADLAVQVFDPPATCGVTLYLDGEPVTVAASGAVAGQVEETQYEVGEGPCLHCLDTGETVDVPDLAAEERWPDYRTHALALGLVSCHAVPLHDGDRVVGALNVHAAQRGVFTPDVQRALALFAAQTSAALELLRRDLHQRQLGEQLQEALASRAVIDQAMGIVMATRRCGPDDAFAFLRRTSQNANRKLRDVATDLVAAVADGRGPGPAGGAVRAARR